MTSLLLTATEALADYKLFKVLIGFDCEIIVFLLFRWRVNKGFVSFYKRYLCFLSDTTVTVPTKGSPNSLNSGLVENDTLNSLL